MRKNRKSVTRKIVVSIIVILILGISVPVFAGSFVKSIFKQVEKSKKQHKKDIERRDKALYRQYQKDIQDVETDLTWEQYRNERLSEEQLARIWYRQEYGFHERAKRKFFGDAFFFPNSDKGWEKWNQKHPPKSKGLSVQMPINIVDEKTCDLLLFRAGEFETGDYTVEKKREILSGVYGEYIDTDVFFEEIIGWDDAEVEEVFKQLQQELEDGLSEIPAYKEILTTDEKRRMMMAYTVTDYEIRTSWIKREIHSFEDFIDGPVAPPPVVPGMGVGF